MLRVGLTGGLGSGKSTVAALLQERGAWVLSADDLGRGLMQPGTAVYAAILERFGVGVVLPDGRLDRHELARLAFSEGRVEELNAIVHPATIALQQQLIEDIVSAAPEAIVVVESALLFETQHGAPGGEMTKRWRSRFDVLVLVAATEEHKIARFVARSGGGDVAALEAEARLRLARMISDAEKAPECEFVIANDGSREALACACEALWQVLVERTRQVDFHCQPG